MKAKKKKKKSSYYVSFCPIPKFPSAKKHSFHDHNLYTADLLSPLNPTPEKTPSPPKINSNNTHQVLQNRWKLEYQVCRSHALQDLFIGPAAPPWESGSALNWAGPTIS
jgi:hypothetical protein